MGAATMDSMIAQLVPTAAIRRLCRFKLRSTSSLGFERYRRKRRWSRSVPMKSMRLRRGCATVEVVQRWFSAHFPRAQRASGAVPAGEVDFVATDAIGMG